VDRRTVKFTLDRPVATFLTRTVTTPIISQRRWQKVVEQAQSSQRPLAHLLNVKTENPVGTGPFVLREWREGAYLYLEKNPLFFGQGLEIGPHRLGPFIDGIILKRYNNTDVAIMAIKRGDIDMLWWGVQQGYIESLLKTRDVRLFINEKSGLYFLGFNVRKSPFNDPVFRRAAAVLMVGIIAQEWFRMIGIPVRSRPMALAALIEKVRSGSKDFDMFVFGYGHLSLDPDYLRSFFHSENDKAGGWNSSGYRNPEFDRIADESARTMDVEKRRKIIWEMQRIVMRDIPVLPLYNPKLVEAVRESRFQGWVPMLGGVGNMWSFCRLKARH
jgi:ABC-type transport system substrate-binding protein